MENEHPAVEDSWTARSVRPRTLFYVAALFVAFIALAEFVVHSREAVVALALTGFGSIVGLVPNVLGRIEYRLTAAGLFKKRLKEEGTDDFKEVFAWDQLSRIQSTGSGFKYFKKLERSSFWARFWKLQISDKYSGEFHVEEADRGRVVEAFQRRGIPTGKATSDLRLGRNS
jgi:hypothetical protein